MKGSKTNLPEDPNDLANVDAEELSTNQEATPIPLFWGTFRFSARWITPILNEYHQPAPQQGGKSK